MRGILPFVILVLIGVLLVAPERWVGGGLDSNALEMVAAVVHVALFFVLTLCVASFVRRQSSGQITRSELLHICALALIAAVVTELAQLATTRSASVYDFSANCAGVGLAAAWMVVRSWRWLAVTLGLLALLLIWLALIPYQRERGLMLTRSAVFPEMLDLNDTMGLWQPQGGAVVEIVDQALLLRCGAGSYLGMRLEWVPAVDFSSYEALVMDLENLGDPVVLGLRVDSVTESGEIRKSYSELHLPTGRDLFALPLADLEPDLEAADVQRLILFAGEDAAAYELLMWAARVE